MKKENLYFEKLKTYEDFQLHYDYIIKKIWSNEDLLKAICISQQQHNHKRYLYDWIYNRHPLRVARILIEEFNITEIKAIIIWLLHDLIEWTDYDEKDILNIFWDKIYKWVKKLSIQKWQDWAEFLSDIEKSWDLSLLYIKIADKLDNNRWLFFSENKKEIEKSILKTETIIFKMAEKYLKISIDPLNKSINNLKNKLWEI